MNFILGLANFQNYYHKKKSFNLTKRQKIDILKNLKKNKINEIDTSPDYGNSEQLIGLHCNPSIKIHSKLRAIPNTRDKILLKKWVDKNLFTTLKNLKNKNIDTYFFHGPNDLLKYQGKICHDILMKYKDKGFFKKIGISIYDPKAYEKIFSNFFIENIQAPVNIFDHRIISKKWVKLLKKYNFTLSARSLFLQGVLVDKNLSYKIKYSKSKKIVDKWFDYIEKNKLNSVEECLNFAFTANIKNVVLGLNNLKQINQITKHKLKYNKSLLNFKTHYKRLIDPRKW